MSALDHSGTAVAQTLRSNQHKHRNKRRDKCTRVDWPIARIDDSWKAIPANARNKLHGAPQFLKYCRRLKRRNVASTDAMYALEEEFKHLGGVPFSDKLNSYIILGGGEWLPCVLVDLDAKKRFGTPTDLFAPMWINPDVEIGQQRTVDALAKFLPSRQDYKRQRIVMLREFLRAVDSVHSN